MENITIGGVLIKWLGNAGFMMKGQDMTIYIDPVNLNDTVSYDEMADILLITHENFGHCDPDSIRKVRKPDCTTLIPENMSLQFRGDARRIIEGDSLVDELSIKGVDIEVVPTYDSCNKSTSLGKGVGYFFKFEGLGIYHAGHTCMAAGLNSESVDIAFLPISDAGVMDSRQAIDALSIIRPRFVIPMCHDSDMDSRIQEFTSAVKESFPSVEIIIP